MKLIILNLLIGLFLFSTSGNLMGQEKYKELGLRFSSIQSADLLYKFGKEENKLTTLRLKVPKLGYYLANGVGNPSRLTAQFELGLGKEYRSVLSNKFMFYHGPELFLGLAYSEVRNNNDNYNRSQLIKAGLAYKFGIQYNVTSRVGLSAEFRPTLTGQFSRYSTNQNDRTSSNFVSSLSSPLGLGINVRLRS